jgi:Na+-driven multidrug efflux pump
MYQGSARALFVRYAVPQMTGLPSNSVYTIVDGVFICNRLGQDAMAVAAVAGGMVLTVGR